MPYEGLGSRHTVTGTHKACTHGQVVSENGFVGSAFKTTQIGRYVDPVSGSPQAIGTTEVFEMQLGGVHEAPASGNLSAAAVGNAVYIDSANNTLGLAAQGLTGTALNAGWLPVGIITEVDATRTPTILRINATGEAVSRVKGTMP
jgi:hypothetical protein